MTEQRAHSAAGQLGITCGSRMSLSFRSVHSSFSAVSRRISCSGRAMGQRNREHAEYPRHVYGSALSTFTYGAVSAAVRRK